MLRTVKAASTLSSQSVLKHFVLGEGYWCEVWPRVHGGYAVRSIVAMYFIFCLHFILSPLVSLSNRPMTDSGQETTIHVKDNQ